MTYYIDIQKAQQGPIPLNDSEIINLASLALRDNLQDAELTIRLVDPEEMQHLNHTYRGQNKTTNVLAFPCKLPPNIELECPLLGDVIVCPKVLQDESELMSKSLAEHWSLIIIHGVLHLLGYDHIKDEDASVMQQLEIKLLAELGYANPYELEGHELE